MWLSSGTGTAYHSVVLEFIPVFSVVRDTRSLVFYLCFVDRCLSFSFGHCVVCPSSIYEFLLLLWLLQTLLVYYFSIKCLRIYILVSIKSI